MSEDASARLSGPRAWYFLFALFLSLVISLISILLVLGRYHGWDARLFCAAAEAAQAGRNPYDVHELGQVLSWNYQPYLLPLFSAACRAPLSFVESYTWIYGALLLAGVAFCRPGPSWPQALPLALGAFSGFAWVLSAGNLSAVEFMLVCAAVFLVTRRRWEWTGLCLGLLGSLKLVTLAYAALLAFIPDHNSRRLRSLGLALLTFAGTFAFSAAISPDLVRPFFEQLLGLIPGQHNVWIEGGAMNNLPLALFLTDTLKLAGLDFPHSIELGAGTLLAALVLFGLLPGNRLAGLARSDYPAFFSIGLMTITLLLPRLKPYSFLLVVPALIVLLRSREKMMQANILLVSTIIPGLFFLIRLFFDPGNRLGTLLFTYTQTLSLLVTLVLLARTLPTFEGKASHA